MNKAELVGAIASKTSVTKTDAEKFVNAFINVVNEKISEKGGIRIAGFGTLAVVKRSGRNGRNPVTGEKIYIESRFIPVFKAGKELKEAVNKLEIVPE